MSPLRRNADAIDQSAPASQSKKYTLIIIIVQKIGSCIEYHSLSPRSRSLCLQHAAEARDLLMWLEVSFSLHDIKACSILWGKNVLDACAMVFS